MTRCLAIASFALATALPAAAGAEDDAVTRWNVGAWTVWRVDRPAFRAGREYPEIRFQPGDRVLVDAGGCAATAEVALGGATDGLVPLRGMLRRELRVPESAEPAPLRVAGACRDAQAWIMVGVRHAEAAEPLPLPRPMDLVSNGALDANGLPLNPKWGLQQTQPGVLPSPVELCFDVPGWFDNPICTVQRPSLDQPTGIKKAICSIGTTTPIAGHVNWFAATLPGSRLLGREVLVRPGRQHRRLVPPDQSGLTTDDPSRSTASSTRARRCTTSRRRGGTSCARPQAAAPRPLAVRWWTDAAPSSPAWSASTASTAAAPSFTRCGRWDCRRRRKTRGRPGRCSRATGATRASAAASSITWIWWATASASPCPGARAPPACAWAARRSSWPTWRAWPGWWTPVPGQHVTVTFQLPAPEAHGRVHGELALRWTGPAAPPEGASSAARPRREEGEGTEHLVQELVEGLTPARRRVLERLEPRVAATPDLVPVTLTRGAPTSLGVGRVFAPAVRSVPDPARDVEDLRRLEALAKLHSGRLPGALRELPALLEPR